MSVSVFECEDAIDNEEINDDALVRLFRQCIDPKDLIRSVVEDENAYVLQLMIEERFDLTHLYWSNNTVLHLAYTHSNLNMIDMLIEAGLDVNAQNDTGAPPWHFAAYNEDECVIEHLMANGIDVNAVDACGTSLAHRAAGDNNDLVLGILIAAGAVVNCKDDCGATPLHEAAMLNSAATIGHLIGRCDVNAADDNGDTPLLLTLTNNCTFDFCVSLLINAGANVWAKNHRGDSPVFAALRQRFDRILELMIDAIVAVDVNVAEPDEGLTPMHVAVLHNNVALAAKLVAAGANVNARTKAQQTPLHMFAWSDCMTADEEAVAAGRGATVD